MKNLATLRGLAAIVLGVMVMGLGRGFRDSSQNSIPESEVSRTPAPSVDPVQSTFRDSVGSVVSPRVLESMVDAWLMDGRDPFALEPPVRLTLPPDPLPSLQPFQLSAVWIQPGRRLAVINGQVVQAGERIGGCTLERCEPNAVWLANDVAARRLPLQRKLSPPTRSSP